MKYWRFCHIGLAIVLALCLSYGTASAQTKPWQFIAKMYTEGLGRAPDQAGWQSYVSFLSAANGVEQTVQKMREIGIGVYNSGEFNSLGYDNASKLLALYRGGLNREPDSAGYYAFLNSLNSGATTWKSTVNSVFYSPEFNSLATSAVLRAQNNKPYYYWGTTPVMSIPTTGAADFYGGTGDDLQAILNRKFKLRGGTVTLAQKAVVRIDKTLWIPPNVTLTTYGQPDHFHYANMARLVRGGDSFATSDNWTTQPLVLMDSPGAKLSNVWIDGQASWLSAVYPSLFDSTTRSYKVNVRILADGPVEVTSCRLSDPPGFTNLHAVGDGYKLIAHNLVTGYGTEHYFTNKNDVKRSDGISIKSNATVVEYNHIVDATDVGIIVFHAGYPDPNDPHPKVQSSIVRFNQILNAGNSALAAIAIDPASQNADQGSPPGNSYSFRGTEVSQNTFWTSQGSHMDFGLLIGTRVLFNNPFDVANDGLEGNFSSNTTGTEFINTNAGILVNGMRNTRVSGNAINVALQAYYNLPEFGVVINSDPNHASGTIQTPWKSYADSELTWYEDHRFVYISGPRAISAPSRGSEPTPGPLSY